MIPNNNDLINNNQNKGYKMKRLSKYKHLFQLPVISNIRKWRHLFRATAVPYTAIDF